MNMDWDEKTLSASLKFDNVEDFQYELYHKKE